MAPLQTYALAKINLTLRIVGRRADGYHDIVSLVSFADLGDLLTFEPGPRLDLDVIGPNAAAIGDANDNLVLLAAHALSQRVRDLKLGQFKLTKLLPVGAGLGGGSADAAAALRLLALANNLELGDARILTAAERVGADVSVCLSQKSRVMSGIGSILSDPMDLPSLPAVIVFPGVPVPTNEMFSIYDELGVESLSGNYPDHPESHAIPLERDKFIAFLNTQTNDLARATNTFTPVVARVEERLHKTSGVRLVRMTGSGSSVFAIYDRTDHAKKAAEELAAEHRDWWVTVTKLG